MYINTTEPVFGVGFVSPMVAWLAFSAPYVTEDGNATLISTMHFNFQDTPPSYITSIAGNWTLKTISCMSFPMICVINYISTAAMGNNMDIYIYAVATTPRTTFFYRWLDCHLTTQQQIHLTMDAGVTITDLVATSDH